MKNGSGSATTFEQRRIMSFDIANGVCANIGSIIHLNSLLKSHWPYIHLPTAK